ncbi:MAG: Gfo/Idh/MocA family oxidoreductase, partial [Planctomycetota bacterium]
MKKLRAVIVGCGAMGSAHGRALAGLPGATVGATVDTNGERAQALAKELGATEWGTDWRSYVERPDIDIAVVTTYPSTHAEIAAP